MAAATDASTRVSQHLAVWDVGGGTGSITLFAAGRELARLEVTALDDFAALVTMLADPRGAWYDPLRRVVTGPPGPGGGGR